MSKLSSERIEKQLHFLREADKLKLILRRTRVSDGSRRENSAEHSWHLGLMAMLLCEHSPGVDRTRVTEMAMTHDLVETYAGDTFVYGDQMEGKATREQEAASQLFDILPDDQSKKLHALWNELEEGKTQEAKFVRALDRLQPLMLHDLTDGVVWQEHGVTRAQVLERVGEIETSVPELWPTALGIIDRATKSGRLG